MGKLHHIIKDIEYIEYTVKRVDCNEQDETNNKVTQSVEIIPDIVIAISEPLLSENRVYPGGYASFSLTVNIDSDVTLYEKVFIQNPSTGYSTTLIEPLAKEFTAGIHNFKFTDLPIPKNTIPENYQIIYSIGKTASVNTQTDLATISIPFTVADLPDLMVSTNMQPYKGAIPSDGTVSCSIENIGSSPSENGYLNIYLVDTRDVNPNYWVTYPISESIALDGIQLGATTAYSNIPVRIPPNLGSDNEYQIEFRISGVNGETATNNNNTWLEADLKQALLLCTNRTGWRRKYNNREWSIYQFRRFTYS